MNLLRAIALFFLLSSSVLAQPLVNIRPLSKDPSRPVWFVKRDALPMLDVAVILPAGSVRDGDKPGLASLTAYLLATAPGGDSEAAFAKKLARNGIKYNIDVQKDFVQWHFRSLSDQASIEHLEQAISALLLQPDFKRMAYGRVKAQLAHIHHIHSLNPKDIVPVEIYKHLFQAQNYGHAAIVDKVAYDAINPKAVYDFYQKYYLRQNAKIAIVGAISAQQAKEIAKRYQQGLKAPVSQAVLHVDKKQRNQVRIITMPTTQANIVLATYGYHANAKERIAMLLGNEMLGGSYALGRLNNYMRQEMGYAYSISSFWWPLSFAGVYGVKMQVDKNKAHQALQDLYYQVARFAQFGPTSTEFNQAKKALIASYPMRFSSAKSLINTLSFLLAYDYLIDTINDFPAKVEALDLKTVHRVMQNQLKGPWLTLIVGA